MSQPEVEADIAVRLEATIGDALHREDSWSGQALSVKFLMGKPEVGLLK